MYFITGGAGFIGSNIAAALDASGEEVVVADWLGNDDIKWRNVAKRCLHTIILPSEIPSFISENRNRISGVFHMGAISTTTERDADAIVQNNFRLSVAMWQFATEAGIPLVYASSAATYGTGAAGFIDDSTEAHLATLAPLNAYGWSKHLFDRWVARQIARKSGTPPRWAGLKFFNVYGPNEYHKGGQRSVAVQLHAQISTRGSVQLFRSDNPDYADGEQLRDFVWIDDCVSVARWAMDDRTATSGIYNVGSGTARSFREMADIIFAEMGHEPNIEFVDLPASLRGKYQYFTCASLSKLRAAGYSKPSTSLEDGLRRYVEDYLTTQDPYR